MKIWWRWCAHRKFVRTREFNHGILLDAMNRSRGLEIRSRFRGTENIIFNVVNHGRWVTDALHEIRRDEFLREFLGGWDLRIQTLALSFQGLVESR